MQLPEGTRLMILAPVVRGRKGEYRKELAEWQKKGFQRVKINGEVTEIGDAPKLDKKFKHDIDVVVDRIVVRPDIASRLADSFEQALKLADGLAIAEFVDKPLGKATPKAPTNQRTTRTSASSSPNASPAPSQASPSRKSSRAYSRSNAPSGACPQCDGLGTELQFEAELVVPDGSLSLQEGAVYPWAKTGATSPYYEQTLESLAKHYKVSMKTPWEKLPKHVQLAILFGSGDEEVEYTYWDGARNYKTYKPFEGVIGNIARRWKETDSEWGARGTLALPVSPSLRSLPWLPPQTPGACRKGRRQAHRRSLRNVDPRRQRLVRGFAENLHETAKRNRDPHPEGDPRPPSVPR